MADEKKVVSECEYKEVDNDQQNAEAPAGNEPKEEKKEKKKVPKWLKTTGQVIEGGLAIFGTIIGSLLIFDKATSKRRQRKYEAWQQSQQTPTYTPPATTFQEEFHNEESQI